jgi:DNA polymerase-3 subunit gamma/tau
LEAARGIKKPMNPPSPIAHATAPVTQTVPAAPPVAQPRREVKESNAMPPWMTDAPDMPPPYDFPDGMEAGEQIGMLVEQVAGQVIAPAPETAVKTPRPFVAVPVTALNWDGNWPQLAATLRVRGVAQQLAQQSELIMCDVSGAVPIFKLRIAVETLRAAGSVDKLAAALTEQFGRSVRVETEIGAVEQTANTAAMAERDARQKQTEQLIHSDPFVQNLMREFGAKIVPGSIKPI